MWPLEQLAAVCRVGRAAGLIVHLDGARLWHASAASGVSEADFAAPFDTVNVCFSKGLGAPIGSALAGSRDVIRRARRFKQQFGGGMRQAGIIAAAALHALEHHRPELARDVERAHVMARALSEMDGVQLDPSTVHSNIIRFTVSADAGTVSTRCYEKGVYMLPNGQHGLRAVLHRDITDDDVDAALRVIADCV